MIRCAAYARMSRDEAEDGLGLDRQIDAIEKFAGEKGWTLDPRWTLRETASASVKKPRPEFERLLRAIENGDVSLVVVYAPDRITRRLRDTARLLDVVEASGCEVYFVVGGDLGSGYSRGMAGVLGGVAAMEVQVMSERHRMKIRQTRREGKVTNGGRRPFGYEFDRSTLVEHEVKLLREAYDRLQRGEGVSAIAKDWNRRGVPTATYRRKDGTVPDTPSRWTTKTLRGTLSRPALCGRVMEWEQVRGSDGRMVRNQVLVTKADGTPVKAAWPTVFTEEEFDRLQLVLAARTRMAPEWTNETKHLLTGLLICERCGGTMVSFKQTSGALTYACRDFRHLSRDEASLDAHVLSLINEKNVADEFEVAAWVDPAGAQTAEQIGVLETRKADTIKRLVSGAIQPETFTAIVAEFDREIAELREHQVQEVVQQFEVVAFPSFPDVAEMPFKDRRAFVRMCVHRVLVKPSKRGRGFDPSSVEVIWWPRLRVERAWSEKNGAVAMTLKRAPLHPGD